MIVADTWTPLPNIPGAFYDAPLFTTRPPTRFMYFGALTLVFNPSNVVQIYNSVPHLDYGH